LPIVDKDYYAGVIEGFYGQPWTQKQRLNLLPQMAEWGLNTYFYGPKDDLKHRAIWRQSYDEQELSQLRELIAACNEHGIRFIYGLSPGLDIQFSDTDELDIVKARLGQLIDVGARHFALLFDDLPGNMSPQDVERFESVAEAQCFVTNSVFEWLREQFDDSGLFFCPTPYCDRMDRNDLGGTDYLDQLGKHLAAGIECFWTGPEIVSQTIDAESIRDLSDRIGRAPVIWDNLHANDYDLRRLFCGPYSGRPAETVKLVRGVMANANNEFPINYMAFRTMAECLNDPDHYEPRKAFIKAVATWIDSYASVRNELKVEDLQFLADCYYLPFEEGDEAIRLQQLISKLLDTCPNEWGEDYDLLVDYQRRVYSIFEILTELNDRDLFYAWSRRVWELREEIGLLKDFLERKKEGGDESAGIALDHHLLHTCRGGITANLQRFTTIGETGRFRSAR
jgi:protein O-GlcNAcase/histone acetyltransferase